MTSASAAWITDLMNRLTTIETRLGRVEGALGWQAETGAQSSPNHLAPPPLPLAVFTPPDDRGVLQAEILDAAPPLEVPIAPAQSTLPPRVPWGQQRSKASVEGGHEVPLENTIGRNWTSWIGAIVVVLGVLFFLKYAWDQGWLALSPAARVGSTIGAGLVFVIAGEWVRVRQMRVLAGTLAGIGVAIVMAAFLAGYALFDVPVFSSKVAAAGVCIAAAGGIWLALRMNVLTLAIIALLGAYLAPAILQSGRDESLVLVLYLGALASVGWVLAYLRPNWNAMRWFVWTWTVVWMLGWLARYGISQKHTVLALAAVAFFFSGFLSEAILTLRRALRVGDANSESTLFNATAGLENSLALLSLLTTAAAMSVCFVLLHDAPAEGRFFQLDPTAAIALGLACVHFRLSTATPSRLFARSSLLQSAALVTLAIPLALGHVAITAAWLVLAVTLAGLAYRRNSEAIRVWAVSLLGLALMRLFTLDLMDEPLCRVLFTITGQGVSGWLLIGCAAGLAAYGMAWLCGSSAPNQRSEDYVKLGSILAGAGTIVLFAASGICWSGTPLTILWLIWTAAIVTLAQARQGQRLSYAQNAAIALFVILLKWLSIDGLRPIAQNWNHPVNTMLPLMNSVTLAGVLLIALAIWLRRTLSEEARLIVPAGIAIVGFATANFEAIRAVDYFANDLVDVATVKLVTLSVLWAVMGLAAVVVGFARDLRTLRYAALSLLAITLAKILFIDLAQVQPVYRILSFLAVGLLFLCVSFVYHRQTHPT
jgi:uncharacterized membrane protein